MPLGFENTTTGPVSKMIPYGKQDISDKDIAAVVDVLKSDFLTQGPVVPAFERAVATKVCGTYAVASNSATSSLHLACLALGVGAGDRVWTSPITFVASANCALYCGAQIDFVDIDPATFNLSVDCLADKLAVAEKNGTLPKVVIPVHMCGQSCDMRGISELARQYGFAIIEDASHAIGGRYQGDYIGGNSHSDITVFSFHPVKIITSAEGGMATTNDQNLADRMRRFREHGVTRERDLMAEEPDGAWRYEQIALGFNYRMTEMQAALGLSQFERLDEFVSERAERAMFYNDAFADSPVEIPGQHADTQSAWHLYVVRIAPNRRRETFDWLRELGIGVNVHYIPVHTQPFFRRMGFRNGDFPAAENYYRSALSIPLFPKLAAKEQQFIVDSICRAVDV